MLEVSRDTLLSVGFALAGVVGWFLTRALTDDAWLAWVVLLGVGVVLPTAITTGIRRADEEGFIEPVADEDDEGTPEESDESTEDADGGGDGDDGDDDDA